MNVDLTFRLAEITDLEPICRFTDFWLAGRGLKIGAKFAVNDYFISPSQHSKYISRYTVLTGWEDLKLIAWSVKQPNGTLTHLLVAGTHRHRGIGKHMLVLLSPSKVHSKSDQSTGNPGSFYKSQGYVKVDSIQSRGRLDIDKIKPNRPKNIDIYVKSP